jgi:peptidoglycan hydrolase-like protein with peptidoglycan-binding domain
MQENNTQSTIGKLKGKRSPSNRPAVNFEDYIVSIPPAPIVDSIPVYMYPMDGNDVMGDCVVADLDHAIQTISGLLTGTQRNFTPAQIISYYQTQNPNFDPNGTASTNGPGSSADGGMDIQTFLEYAVAQSLILGFGKVDWTKPAVLQAAIYLGLALIGGVQLQQAQLDQFPVLWDSIPGSPIDGGHGIPYIAYNAQGATVIYKTVSWGQIVPCTAGFVLNQTDELWFIITKDHIDNPDFRDGFDLIGFSNAVSELTDGKVIVPIPVLCLGSSGSIVKSIQAALNTKLGYNLIIDGKFGALTKAAVIKFQSLNGLVQDGLVGKLTLTKLQCL